MNEECGVIGVYNVENAAYLTKTGLYMLQHRGQEGAGIISYDGSFHKHKASGLVNNVFNEDIIKDLPGKYAIGHVRYATSGDRNYENIQPFLFYNQKLNFSLCHNGNIVNSLEVKEFFSAKGVLFQSNSDSEILGHLIMSNYHGDFVEALKISLNTLQGAFAFLIFFDNKLYCCRDKNYMRPLSIGKCQSGYVVSSETCAFSVLDCDFMFDVAGGEIIEISETGIEHFDFAKNSQNSMCSMEYIYFSRPDSVIDGFNVYQVRKQLGEQLAIDYAKEIEEFGADIIVGVPDSSLACAVGLSQSTGIINEHALVKHKYSGRSFIEPTTTLRNHAVKLKLAVIKEVVENKKIILIDDSIVRGTTSKKLITILKEAGAKEIMLMVTSPPIIDCCYYGVDIHSKEELVSYNRSLEEIQNFIGCEHLHYLSVESLKNVLQNQNVCVGCFTSKYPTYIGGKDD